MFPHALVAENIRMGGGVSTRERRFERLESSGNLGSEQRKVLFQKTKSVPIDPALRSVPVVQIVPGTKTKRESEDFSKGRRWSEAIAVGSLAFAEKRFVSWGGALSELKYSFPNFLVFRKISGILFA
jgi:hypothetical protein